MTNVKFVMNSLEFSSLYADYRILDMFFLLSNIFNDMFICQVLSCSPADIFTSLELQQAQHIIDITDNHHHHDYKQCVGHRTFNRQENQWVSPHRTAYMT